MASCTTHSQANKVELPAHIRQITDTRLFKHITCHCAKTISQIITGHCTVCTQ